ncbi:unnamed protein product [Agarophyton chilense]
MSSPSAPPPHSPARPIPDTRLSLNRLPEDVLLLICDFAAADTLHTLSIASERWRYFIQTKVWPRRLAFSLRVRAIRFVPPTTAPNTLRFISHTKSLDASAWVRILQTFQTYSSSRLLCICVALSKHDSITSLALRYAVSVNDILRTNALFAEHQLASRTHVFVPLIDDSAVLSVTGIPRHMHSPFLVTDITLSNKYFLVTDFRGSPCASHTLSSSRSNSQKTYVRQLLVKLMAKGLSVLEDEVRYYLQENDYDVPKAYKHMMQDHQFRP